MLSLLRVKKYRWGPRALPVLSRRGATIANQTASGGHDTVRPSVHSASKPTSTAVLSRAQTSARVPRACRCSSFFAVRGVAGEDGIHGEHNQAWSVPKGYMRRASSDVAARSQTRVAANPTRCAIGTHLAAPPVAPAYAQRFRRPDFCFFALGLPVAVAVAVPRLAGAAFFFLAFVDLAAWRFSAGLLWAAALAAWAFWRRPRLVSGSFRGGLGRGVVSGGESEGSRGRGANVMTDGWGISFAMSLNLSKCLGAGT